MKKKDNGMSPDMFHDALSSTPIPVFTNANDAAPNAPSEQIPSVTDVTEVSFDANPVQNELIKIDFDKQTVSARDLYGFLEPSERFHFWFKRMISYGLLETVDFTTVKKLTVVNNSGTKEIGDYLLTIDAAKHIAMIQRNDKGKIARTYFINIEKLYHQQIASQKKESVSLWENLKEIVAQLEKKQEDLQQNYQLLIEKREVLEKEHEQQKMLLKQSLDLFTQKVDVALKSLVTGVDASSEAKPIEAPVSIASLHIDKKHSFNGLPHIYKMWYNELPPLLSTPDAERIGSKYKMSRTTIFRLLRNQQSNLVLFRKLRYGQYEKFYTVFE
jgi:phage anti-repressor protein